MTAHRKTEFAPSLFRINSSVHGLSPGFVISTRARQGGLNNDLPKQNGKNNAVYTNIRVLTALLTLEGCWARSGSFEHVREFLGITFEER